MGFNSGFKGFNNPDCQDERSIELTQNSWPTPVFDISDVEPPVHTRTSHKDSSYYPNSLTYTFSDKDYP